MTLWTRRHFLATSTVMVVQRSLVAAQSARTITIAAEPLEPLGDYGLGVRLGASEAERAAKQALRLHALSRQRSCCSTSSFRIAPAGAYSKA